MHLKKLQSLLFIGISGSLAFLAMVGGVTFEEDIALTLPQKKLLDQFRSNVVHKLPKEYMKKEIYLVKWLRASHFQLDLAEERLLRNLEWRKEQRMDSIHSEDFSDMWQSDIRYYLDGRDKLGRPFVFIDMRNIDPRKIILQGRGDRLERYVGKGIDEACGLVQELGEKYGNMTRGNALVNWEGFSLLQHVCLRCLPFLARMIIGFVDHFPGCLDKLIFVNAPTGIEQLLQVGKPLVPMDIRDNIHVYGLNKKIWRKALLQDFDMDQLPPVLGGTKIYKGMELDNHDYNR